MQFFVRQTIPAILPALIKYQPDVHLNVIYILHEKNAFTLQKSFCRIVYVIFSIFNSDTEIHKTAVR